MGDENAAARVGDIHRTPRVEALVSEIKASGVAPDRFAS
jgi:hypothetical protein